MNKFILPIILIVLSICFFVFFIDPVYQEIKVLKAENSQYDEARNKSKELRVVRDDLLKKYNSFSEEDLSRIRKLLPDNVDNIRLAMDVNNIASKYGITIKGIKLASSEVGKDDKIKVSRGLGYDFVTLEFSMSATYDDFIKFITDLKDSLRLVDVVRLDFDAVDQGSGVYKFDVGVKTYWLQ
ncbi:type 4a pilus biogenesis protein PilO [Patescibacteria group bacterium]|nr:type 4a pilus biogenesis protein PilO [Patescibacteria group bacterium]MCG2694608.1 type 4a pilus biogenesis protein PilO [Candidatus Parcubacteria bacterium]